MVRRTHHSLGSVETQVHPESPHDPFDLTDGSYESRVGGLGACVFDLASGERLVFESEVPKRLLDLWADVVGEQLICQIELFVMVLVRWELKDLLAFRRVLLFVDNEAARGAVIKGRSPSPAMDCLCKAWPSSLQKPLTLRFGGWSEHPRNRTPLMPHRGGTVLNVQGPSTPSFERTSMPWGFWCSG